MDTQERKYFENTKNTINKLISQKEEVVKNLSAQVDKQKKYIADNYFELSRGQDIKDIDKFYTELAELDDTLTDNEKQLKVLKRQRLFPYFARIDFQTKKEKIPVYIGLNNVLKDEKVYVYDWRAPISSMYYDFELGKAFYYVNGKATTGEITLKRQFKIEKGILKSYFDTNLTINDEILRDILSKNVSTKMRQIVATIQKEQNKIVRSEEFDHLIVQGVAGSGKTSIALHRAAYLLYRHRKTLKSSDILIISPNNIFSSYISEVLPELGEENLSETTFSQIASVELKKIIQTREEMLDNIATNPKQSTLNEISFKSSFEYLDELLKFLRNDLVETFTPKDLTFIIDKDEEGNIKSQLVFSEEETRDLYFNKFKGETIHERISKIAWQYAMKLSLPKHYKKEQNRGLRTRFEKLLYNFLPINDVDKVFDIFLARMDLKPQEGNIVRYMDKGAMLLIKYFLYGFDHDFSAKYLIIDEMQDFTPVDLFMFKKLWSCPSILLGDINQCIEKCLPPEYNNTVTQMWGGKLIELTKTYRSTKQIATFTHNMLGLKNIEYVNRDGDEPQIIKSKPDKIADTICDVIETQCGDFDHIAIICKCKKEAKELEKSLKHKIKFKYIENPDDYNHNVLLTTCATAKGIEFDAVIIPFADKENYNNNLDRNILYVSSTRALHKLFFISTTTPTPLIK